MGSIGVDSASLLGVSPDDGADAPLVSLSDVNAADARGRTAGAHVARAELRRAVVELMDKGK